MAKMTYEQLKALATAYVDKAKQAGSWVESKENLYKCLDKIGKMVNLEGDYTDRLTMLDGDDLDLGKTIEEYFIDLTQPIDYPADTSGSAAAEGALKSYLPDVEEPSYSYTLGKKVFPTSVPYNNVERAAINTGVAADFLSLIPFKLNASVSSYKYALKKQLLGNMAAKVIAGTKQIKVGNVVSTPDAIASTEILEKFVVSVKNEIENAGFLTDSCLAATTIGAVNPKDLLLVVRKGIIPGMQVQVLAAAINKEYAWFGVDNIAVVDDFGDQETVVAMLIDKRGVKLHNDYAGTRNQENGLTNMVNLFVHREFTGFLSKFTFVKVFTNEA